MKWIKPEGLLLILGFLSTLAFFMFRLAPPLESIKRPEWVALIPDDAYYYFTIARNIASGEGSTFDDITPTNGYHPAWMGLASVVYLFVGETNHLPIRLLLITQAILGAGVIGGLVTWLAVRGCSPGSLAIFLVLMGTPWITYGRTDGLESGLVQTWIVYFFMATIRLKEMSAAPSIQDFALGAVLALGVMARLDLALVCLSVGLIALWSYFRTPIHRRPTMDVFWSRAGLWALPPLMTISIYLYLNSLVFDTLTPISGKLKNSFPSIGFRSEWLVQHPLPFLLMPVIAMSLRWLPERFEAGERWAMQVLACSCFLLLANTLCFTRWGVHQWHFTLIYLVGAISLTLLVEKLGASVAAKAAIFTVVLAMSVAGQFFFTHKRADRAFQARSYEAAQVLRTQSGVPQRIGMTDAGAFGYFMGGGVVNLDGVVNNLAYQVALRDRGLRAYLDEQNITGIAHHAVPMAKVARGYGTFTYRVRSHLFGTTSEIELSAADEIYRREYNDGTGPVAFIVWKRPVTARR